MTPIHALLAALGSDSDTMARSLSQHGFRGARGLGQDCPLANFLRANGIAEPAVDTCTVSYTLGEAICVEELSPAAEDFVMLFDDGAYPELET